MERKRNDGRTLLGTLAIAALAFSLLACGKGPGKPGAKRGGGPVVHFGIGAMLTPEEGRRYYLDLVDWLSKETGYDFQVVEAKDYAEVNQKLQRGEIDVSFVCSGPYVKGHDEYGLELLAQPRAYGKNVYHSYIIVNSKSQARSLADLQRKSFAFTDPDSNTGCLVPTYLLAREGKDPRSFFSRIFFTGSHDGSIAGVAYRFVDGAAVDSLIWEFKRSTDTILTDHTRIIQVSPGYANPPVVARPGADPEVKKAVREALLSMDQDEKGKAILERMKIDRFTSVEDKAYDSIREMKEWVDRKQKQEQR